jgi:hypothetical protein
MNRSATTLACGARTASSRTWRPARARADQRAAPPGHPRTPVLKRHRAWRAGASRARARARNSSSSCSLAVTRWAIAMGVAGVLPSLCTMWTWPNRDRGPGPGAVSVRRAGWVVGVVERLRALRYHYEGWAGMRVPARRAAGSDRLSARVCVRRVWTRRVDQPVESVGSRVGRSEVSRIERCLTRGSSRPRATVGGPLPLYGKPIGVDARARPAPRGPSDGQRVPRDHLRMSRSAPVGRPSCAAPGAAPWT